MSAHKPLYEALAASYKIRVDEAIASCSQVDKNAVGDMIRITSNILGLHNPSFSNNRFLEACNYYALWG